MKNRYLYIVIFLAFFSIVIGYITGNVMAPRNHVIHLTRDGFDPDDQLIAKGDSITWVNVDARLHWPASNSHPTHSEYHTDKKGCLGSALDACRELKKGEVFTFMFDRIGEFGIHDHLLPGDTMSVRVVSKSFYIVSFLIKDQAAQDFDTANLPLGDDFRNLEYAKKRQLIIKLAKANPVTAWTYLKKAALKNGEATDNVHEFSHTIGREIHKQLGFEGIRNCSNEFGFGCYHGVAEQALLTTGKSSLVKVEEECLKIYPHTSKKPMDDPGCIHGMGHGLLSWNNLNINQSLTDCNILTKEYRLYCWDGVFMEYSMSGAASFDELDPWKICRELNPQFQKKCASYMVSMYSNSMKFNSNVFAEMCTKAPDEWLMATCANRIGNKISQINKGELKNIISECKSILQDELSEYCLIGAAREVVFQKYTNWKITASSICRKTSGEYATTCSNYEKEEL